MHKVKCLYCGEQFDRDREPTKQVSARRYAHFSCWEKHISEMTQEEKDMNAFFEYAKELFKEDYNYLLTVKLADRYIKENNYTYSGMLKTLKWYYEKKGNDISKSNGSIGIIPYIYREAMLYYYSLYQAQLLNEKKDINLYLGNNVREFIIESPRVETRMPPLWLQEDEED